MVDRSAGKRIEHAIDALKGQKRKAAEYIGTHMAEVAMLSLRTIAGRARVSPGTLVGLAKALNYESYNEFRSAMQAEQGGVLDYFSMGAKALQSSQPGESMDKLTAMVVEMDMQNIRTVLDAEVALNIETAGRLLNKSRRVYVLGTRTCYGVAHNLFYMLQLIRDDVQLVEDTAGIAADTMHAIGPEDALVVFGYYPYVTRTLELVDAADRAGANIITITDSPNSVLIRNRSLVLPTRTSSPWIFGSVTTSVVLSQALAAHLLALGGQAVLERIQAREKMLSNLGIFTS